MTTENNEMFQSKFIEMVNNVITSRSELLGKFLDPRRNINDECGYPGRVVDLYQLQDLYDREPVARRVVDVLPKESWQVQPTVYEDENPTVTTPFEEAWRVLGKSVKCDTSYYQDEHGSGVWEYLIRADILSGIGSYGVILLGLDDGLDLSEPVPLGGKLNLVYLRCFPESLAQIIEFNSDQTSSRFGQPERYLITFNDVNAQRTTGLGLTVASKEVHWTRVVHIVDNLSSSEVIGTSRMMPVLNRLLDLQKLYGGSAEMYWRGAFPGLALSSHPQLGGDVEIDRTSVRGQMENYMNGLQRYLAIIGMEVKSLAPQVVDPTPQITVQLEAICILINVPIRIFKGSERGDLASRQDDSTWNDRLYYRQIYHNTPRIICPFIDRLIYLGVLPNPKGYSVSWPSLTSVSVQESAAVALNRTTAMAQYIGGKIEKMICPLDFLIRVMNVPEVEAKLIMENIKKVKEDGCGYLTIDDEILDEEGGKKNHEYNGSEYKNGEESKVRDSKLPSLQRPKQPINPSTTTTN